MENKHGAAFQRLKDHAVAASFGERLVSGSLDGRIIVWDSVSGQQVGTAAVPGGDFGHLAQTVDHGVGHCARIAALRAGVIPPMALMCIRMKSIRRRSTSIRHSSG